MSLTAEHEQLATRVERRFATMRRLFLSDRPVDPRSRVT
jgi:hypothetical protein